MDEALDFRPDIPLFGRQMRTPTVTYWCLVSTGTLLLQRHIRTDCMTRKLLLLVCLSLLATRAFAQEGFEHLSPYATGIGRTYSVSSHGLEAVGLNPAMLGLPTDSGLQIQILPFTGYAFHAGPSFRDFSTINAIFDSSSTLSQDSSYNRTRLVNYIKDGKVSGRVDARILGVSFYSDKIGGLALSFTTHAGLRTLIPTKFLNFINSGPIANLTSNILHDSGFDVQALWYNELGLSYGKSYELGKPGDFAGSIAIGGALKYIMGLGYAGMDPGASITINDPQKGGFTTIETHYRIRYSYPDFIDPQNINNAIGLKLITNAPAGTGLGIDLGTTLDLLPVDDHGITKIPLRISASVTDIGSITWSSHTSARTNVGISYIDHNKLGSSDTLKSMLAPIAGQLDTTIGSFTSKLPTAFHLGAQLDLASIGISIPGTDLVFASEYEAGLTDVVGNPQHGRFGAGVGFKIPSKIVSFRLGGGYTMQDGISDATLSLGTTIANSFNLDVATSNLGGLFQGEGVTDIEVAMSLRF